MLCRGCGSVAERVCEVVVGLMVYMVVDVSAK